MKIKIIAVGNLKEEYLKDAATEYRKRLGRYSKIEIVEVAEERLSDKASQKNIENCLKREEDYILQHINDTEYVIIMAIEGQMITSEELAMKISDLMVTGQSAITFVIGSSHGLSDGVKRRANLSLSLSRMTFPHQLTRVILLEQIYRAFKINHNEPYHK
ncbi:23S rRNA (pseudouridine(1915)-N(3))-methyltransferase RlmH [Microaceticoccus formicicus]|uniref:23S rRNA (pseudouridine(1915)-N(3))-methyltransferase RlmH n=1 Tax=Microaceticoccus formicicus TaxID=3118105 RepID=UPI003CCFFD48|nr:23S rRNA (pseudouridine(1915)-N(3))-methyltransferase RlmH [Peptoniphilaceae bacterium AMB_02]